MSSGVRIEGLDELAGLLQHAQDTVVKETRKVVAKGALNIKKDTADRWRGNRHAPYISGAVSYDTNVSGTEVSAEIGPDKARRQGALGNLLEYGSVHNGPIPALSPALDAEEPRFVQAMEDMAARLLGDEK